ncbi:MAG: substrate-binding domain-containing protein, partial [Limisphaerales bacterium]
MNQNTNIIKPEYINMKNTITCILAAALVAAGCFGCKKSAQQGGKVTIQNKGSDTMVNLAQAWAEAYKKVAPNVEVEVSGGGSGVGIAALIKGTVDIANASRELKPSEIEKALDDQTLLTRYLIDTTEHRLGHPRDIPCLNDRDEKRVVSD